MAPAMIYWGTYKDTTEEFHTFSTHQFKYLGDLLTMQAYAKFSRSHFFRSENRIRFTVMRLKRFAKNVINHFKCRPGKHFHN